MIAKGSGYVKGNKQAAHARLGAHFKYIEHRRRDASESRDDRRIFSKDDDVINRREAMEGIMEHSHNQVRYHKIVLSPGKDEPVQDWQKWTREVMHDLEQKKGKELHWYAVYHNNTDNPHVHVVLAGGAENRETGKMEPVKMYAHQDYRFMEASGREHSEHEWYQQIRDYVKEDENEERPPERHERLSSEREHADR